MSGSTPPSVVAVVPARGGSKGIPRKNLVRVGGRPLVEWSIEAALRAETVDRVVVSTDDAEIARVALAAGAEVPGLRPAALAADDTPDLPVFAHVLDLLEAEGTTVDVLVHLRPTSPLRPDGLLDLGVRLLLGDPTATSVRSVSPAARTPFKMWLRGDDGFLEPVVGTWDDELFNRPRQALPPVWMQDGALDVVRAATVRAGSMSGRRILALATPTGVALDIDTPDDLAVADRALSA